ncbi:hypothetical protein BaRGS_00005362 [Batillaria attramentaria]|uniref:Uncharacterized protein n=1 Tax=Batillaria attramentaria TaxID=370345 RepID=A0ABD0LVE0_9CAEN
MAQDLYSSNVTPKDAKGMKLLPKLTPRWIRIHPDLYSSNVTPDDAKGIKLLPTLTPGHDRRRSDFESPFLTIAVRSLCPVYDQHVNRDEGENGFFFQNNRGIVRNGDVWLSTTRVGHEGGVIFPQTVFVSVTSATENKTRHFKRFIEHLDFLVTRSTSTSACAGVKGERCGVRLRDRRMGYVPQDVLVSDQYDFCGLSKSSVNCVTALWIELQLCELSNSPVDLVKALWTVDSVTALWIELQLCELSNSSVDLVKALWTVDSVTALWIELQLCELSNSPVD